jgi:subtilisin family serine protease
MRRTLTVLMLALLATAPTIASAAPSGERTFIVTFRAGTDAKREASNLRAAGRTVRFTYTNALRGVAVDLNPAAVDALRRNPAVTRIEADGVATATGTQTSAPWGLDRIDQAALPLSGTYTWNDAAAGAGVTAYIVDGGVRADHTEFSGRVAAGYTAFTDGGGTADCDGHGTHVAGTTAGATYGVAKSATIVPVRVLDCTGSGAWSGIIAGLDWIVAHHVSGPAVANMSLGGGDREAVGHPTGQAADRGAGGRGGDRHRSHEGAVRVHPHGLTGERGSSVRTLGPRQAGGTTTGLRDHVRRGRRGGDVRARGERAQEAVR